MFCFSCLVGFGMIMSTGVVASSSAIKEASHTYIVPSSVNFNGGSGRYLRWNRDNDNHSLPSSTQTTSNEDVIIVEHSDNPWQRRSGASFRFCGSHVAIVEGYCAASVCVWIVG